MNRLTKRIGQTAVFVHGTCYDPQQVAERLAEYEDTGCTPEEVNGMVFDNALDVKFGVTIDRLRELAEADTDGRCVILKHPLSGSVYRRRNEKIKYKVGGVQIFPEKRQLYYLMPEHYDGTNTETAYEDEILTLEAEHE